MDEGISSAIQALSGRLTGAFHEGSAWVGLWSIDRWKQCKSCTAGKLWQTMDGWVPLRKTGFLPERPSPARDGGVLDTSPVASLLAFSPLVGYVIIGGCRCNFGN